MCNVSPPSKKKKEDSLQDNTRRDGVTETSSAPTTGITEVGSSGLVTQAQDTASHASDGLDSASQTNDHDSAPLVGNPETGNLIPPSFSSHHLNVIHITLYC